MRKFGMGLAALFAAAGFAGSASAFETVPGTFSLRGEGSLILDPNASSVGDDTSDPVISAHFESQTGPPYTVTWHTFVPTSPLLFKDIKSYSFDYVIPADSDFGGGSLRVSFIMDLNGNEIEDYSPTGDQILHLDVPATDTIGYQVGPVSASTGNLIGTPDADTNVWGWAYNPGAGSYNYSDTLAAWGDVRVLSINIVHDAGDGDTFDISNPVTAIPEPASVGLLGSGALMLFRRRRGR